MKTTVIALAFLLTATTILAIAPTSAAVGTCSDLVDSDCPHTFCYGTHSANGRTWCDTYIDNPCRICNPLDP